MYTQRRKSSSSSSSSWSSSSCSSDSSMDASNLLQLQTTAAHQRSPSRTTHTTPQTLHFQTDSKALFGSPADSLAMNSVSRSSSSASSVEASSSSSRPGALSPESTNSSYYSSSSSRSSSHPISAPEDATADDKITTCSRCRYERRDSNSSSNPLDQMISFGLNTHYCHFCASMVGYKR